MYNIRYNTSGSPAVPISLDEGGSAKPFGTVDKAVEYANKHLQIGANLLLNITITRVQVGRVIDGVFNVLKTVGFVSPEVGSVNARANP